MLKFSRKMGGAVFAAILLYCHAFCAFSQTAPAKVVNGYEEPDLSVNIFDTAKMSISPDDRKSIATLLGEYVRNTRPITPEQNKINSKCIALALNVDSENKTAFLANFYLKDGKEPLKVKSEQKTEDIWNTLLTLAQKIYETKNSANQQVASNIAELAIIIYPQNENAIFLSEMARKQNIKASWTAVKKQEDSTEESKTKEPAPAAKARVTNKDGKAVPEDPPGRVVVTQELRVGYADVPREFKLKQQTIKGLDVIKLGADKFAGSTIEIIATTVPTHSPGSETVARFTSTHIGSMMKQGLEEASKAVRQRYPIWGRGLHVNFSFPNQYEHRDGPSASTACAVLLLSLLDGFECSQDIAITGDISADWRVRGVGGVPGKIRGAIKQNVPIAVIPSSDVDQIKDWLLLEPTYYEPLTKIHIFAVDTLGEAVELARKDRSEDIADALQKMSEIQKGLSLQKYYPNSGDTRYRAQLEAVLSKAPKSLNAKLLMDMENHETQKFLSMNASAARLMAIAEPFVKWMDSNKNVSGNVDVRKFHFSDEVYSQANRDLNDVQFKLDQRAMELHGKLREMVEKFKELDATVQGMPASGLNGRQWEDVSQKIRDANSSLAEMRNSISLLFSNERYMEDMRN